MTAVPRLLDRRAALVVLVCAPPTALAQPQPAPQQALLARIDSFGFHSRPNVGVGGFVGLRVFPVVLFKNGDLLTDVAGLGDARGIEAHQRAHPGDWTRWRREGGKLQMRDGKGAWKALGFQTTYPKLPTDFRLDGLYRALSGGGNVAMGGTASVAAWTDYTFSRDGRVTRGGGAGGSSAEGGTAVTARSSAPPKSGRYRIEGLTLSIAYDDGSRESRIVVLDPNDSKGRAIWLDGQGYVLRSR